MTEALATATVHRPASLRVLVSTADDLFRAGLSRLLADEGIDVTAEPPASVVLTDAGAGLPGEGCVVALCDSRGDEAIVALERGAAAVLDRASSPALIAAAIRLASVGAAVMPSTDADQLLAAHRANSAERAATERLSARETEVMALVSTGRGNHEIARELMITASTVKNHVAHIMVKLGARNRTEAAVIAARLRACG